MYVIGYVCMNVYIYLYIYDYIYTYVCVHENWNMGKYEVEHVLKHV